MSTTAPLATEPVLRVFGYINRAMVFVASLLLTGTAVMITYDVARRYLFNAPLPASVEISSLLQAYVIFLPFAFTLVAGQHVRVTLLTSRLPFNVQRRLLALCHCLTGVVCFVLAWYAWEEFQVSYSVNEIMMAPIIVYWWIGKFAAPVGMALFGLQAFALSAHQALNPELNREGK